MYRMQFGGRWMKLEDQDRFSYNDSRVYFDILKFFHTSYTDLFMESCNRKSLVFEGLLES